MQVDRDFATALAYLRLRPYRYGVRSNVSTTITLWSGGLPFLCMIKSGLPLRIFFCKGSVGITKRQTGNGKSPSNKLSVFAVPSLPYCILCRQAQRRHVLYGQESREDGNECSQPLRLKEQLAPLVVKYCFSL